MALKGLSKPYCGEYKYADGKVTYENGYACDKAISYEVTVEAGESNPLYANNGIAENSKGIFANGKLKLGTSDLPPGLSKKIYGLKTATKSYGTDKSVEITVHDDDEDSPFLGFGIIEEHQINDIDKYRAVVLCKVKFDVKGEKATTRAGKVEWTTPEIEATIVRSDEYDSTTAGLKHPWKYDAWFDTEEAADEFLKVILNVTEVEAA